MCFLERGGQPDVSPLLLRKGFKPLPFYTQQNTQPDVFTDYSFGKVFGKAVNLAAKYVVGVRPSPLIALYGDVGKCRTLMLKNEGAAFGAGQGDRLVILMDKDG